MFKILGVLTVLIGLTSYAHAENQCKYTTSHGYAHVVSVPSYALVSINAKYANVKLNASQFPKDLEPGQIYKIEINEPKSKACKLTVFNVKERVQ